MSYQKDRDEFVAVIVEELAGIARTPGVGTDQPWVDVARLILRNAATIQRLAAEDCNRQITDAERKRWTEAEERISAACKPWGIKPTFNGDPRGCCVKLILPSGRWNGWGGKEDGYCVPVR